MDSLTCQALGSSLASSKPSMRKAPAPGSGSHLRLTLQCLFHICMACEDWKKASRCQWRVLLGFIVVFFLVSQFVCAFSMIIYGCVFAGDGQYRLVTVLASPVSLVIFFSRICWWDAFLVPYIIYPISIDISTPMDSHNIQFMCIFFYPDDLPIRSWWNPHAGCGKITRLQLPTSRHGRLWLDRIPWRLTDLGRAARLRGLKACHRRGEHP